jgi:hypothetical protein
VAQGFLLGQNTYLKSYQNCIDFFFVFYSYMIFAIGNSVKSLAFISLIRGVRIIKGSASLKIFKRLSLIVNSLWVSIQNLYNVMMFLLIFLLIMAGMAVTMFGGILEQRYPTN